MAPKECLFLYFLSGLHYSKPYFPDFIKTLKKEEQIKRKEEILLEVLAL